jgi:Ca-activated chloride channel family protein
MRPLRLGSLLFMAGVAATAAVADRSQLCHDDAMVVFDGSGSMILGDAGGRARIDVARDSLRAVLPEVTAMRRTGLVVYGAGGACHVELKLRPKSNAATEIGDIVDRLVATGATPLSGAVLEAAMVLGGGEKSGLVVVLTDGEDNCGVDPCRVAAKLRESAPKVVVHVIGFMMGRHEAVRAACLADETGGLYVPARTLEELKTALRNAFGCPKLSYRRGLRAA